MEYTGITNHMTQWSCLFVGVRWWPQILKLRWSESIGSVMADVVLLHRMFCLTPRGQGPSKLKGSTWSPNAPPWWAPRILFPSPGLLAPTFGIPSALDPHCAIGFPMTVGAVMSWALECVHHNLCMRMCIYIYVFNFIVIHIYVYIYIYIYTMVKPIVAYYF